MTVVVLSKSGCQPCRATKKKLETLGVGYTERDLSADPEALDLAVSLGYQEAPVVLVEREGAPAESWSGYRPERLQALSV